MGIEPTTSFWKDKSMVKELEDAKWNLQYSNERISNMWDNTGIKMPKPPDPEMQQNTWSL
jgi:hypothetical protein